MIAIPVSDVVVRRTLRMLVVAAIAVAALGLSLPSLLLPTKSLAPGRFYFWTSANVVVGTTPRAQAAGIDVGDRIDYSLMPLSERYGISQDGLRLPSVGKTVSFVVDRNGRRHIAALSALPGDWNAVFGKSFPWATAQRASFLVLVLLGSALFLIRPTRLTAAFFLFVAGNGATPIMYYFLPPLGYAVAMAADDALAGLGAIGFLLLASYLNPPPKIGSRVVVGVAALLFAVIVVPLATSDVLELMAGTRPAWPIAGWASFSAVWFCYVVGFALLARLAATLSAPRILRLLAALLATIGTLTILNSMVVKFSPWYFANLPSAVMNRIMVLTDPASLRLPNWQVAAFLIVALALSGAAFRGVSFGTRSTFFRIATFVGLTLLMFASFLPYTIGELFTQLAYLLAFCVFVRAGVAHTGPVLDRLVVYIIAVLLIVAVFVLANLVFAPQFRDYTLVVPLEIFAAIAIGYWVSGLRDLAGCLSLACVDAWNAWAKGNARDERDALTQSLGLAERTRRRGTIAEVRGQMAFSAWRDGEEGAFEQSVDALRSVLGGRNARGIRGFAHAATSHDDELCFEEYDLPEWRSRAALVLCARTNDAGRAQNLAIDALESAERAGLPSLQVLGSIAVAETCPAVRNASLERAHAIARDAGWPALSKSILALRANSRDIGILQPFVDVRLRKSRPARPLFEISFFDAELRQNGAHVSLSEKQLELLLTVATARTGINDNAVIDALWPESEGDAARNSFRVCLHGLRKNAGDARIVMRVGRGYVLHPWADVDLWRFQSLISSCRASGGREGADELREQCDTLRSVQGRRATLGEWFYRFDQMLNRKLDEAARVLDREVTAY